MLPLRTVKRVTGSPFGSHAEKAAALFLLLASSFMVADLVVLWVRPQLLPESAPAPVGPPRGTVKQAAGRYTFDTITANNIFSADQRIPAPLGGQDKEETPALDAPVPTQLALGLVGTLVHSNPARSVATISIKNQNDVVAIRVDGEIPDGLGRVTEILRNRVIFRNNASGRLEYIELAEEGSLNFNLTEAKEKVLAPGIIEVSESERTVKKDDLDKYLKDLPSLLQQARAVPRIGANGSVECYNIADMQSGSIFESLGVRKGDCIESVNGRKIDSPQTAVELFQELKAGDAPIELTFERGGRKENSRFNITR